jgi:hypothetical protein
MTPNPYINSFSMIAFLIKSCISALITLVIPLNSNPSLAALSNSSIEIINSKADGDRVTLWVKVLDAKNNPVPGLNKEDFQITTTDENGVAKQPLIIDFSSPENSIPEPARIVILLDMSGSMKHLDASNIKKLDGAIKGIREILRQTGNSPYKIAIMPIGFSADPTCKADGYIVDAQSLKNNFLSVDSKSIEGKLNTLVAVDVCAATDLYNPLRETVAFLGDKTPDDTTRLNVILFSDGFHNYQRYTKGNEEPKQFDKLKKVLQDNSGQVTVHTLGYGESLKALSARTNCSLRDEQITIENVISQCKVPDSNINGNKITEYIVDEVRLKEIAQLTGGIHEFPGSAKEVAQSLGKFFRTLREYKIVYKQTSGKQAVNYKTLVAARSGVRDINATSKEKTIRLNNFGFQHALSVSDHLIILGIVIVLLLLWLGVFWSWSRNLREDADSLIR